MDHSSSRTSYDPVRGSTTSSVNGLIQQSMTWLDGNRGDSLEHDRQAVAVAVEQVESSRPDSLVPPTPAFRRNVLPRSSSSALSLASTSSLPYAGTTATNTYNNHPLAAVDNSTSMSPRAGAGYAPIRSPSPHTSTSITPSSPRLVPSHSTGLAPDHRDHPHQQSLYAVQTSSQPPPPPAIPLPSVPPSPRLQQYQDNSNHADNNNASHFPFPPPPVPQSSSSTTLSFYTQQTEAPLSPPFLGNTNTQIHQQKQQYALPQRSDSSSSTRRGPAPPSPQLNGGIFSSSSPPPNFSSPYLDHPSPSPSPTPNSPYGSFSPQFANAPSSFSSSPSQFNQYALPPRQQSMKRQGSSLSSSRSYSDSRNPSSSGGLLLDPNAVGIAHHNNLSSYPSPSANPLSHASSYASLRNNNNSGRYRDDENSIDGRADDSTLFGDADTDEKGFYAAIGGDASTDGLNPMAGTGGNGQRSIGKKGAYAAKGASGDDDKAWMNASNGSRSYEDATRMAAITSARQKRQRRKKWFIIGGIALIAIIAAIVGIAIYLKNRNSNSNSSSSSGSNSASDRTGGNANDSGKNTGAGSNSNTGNDSNKPSKPKEIVSGSDGSIIRMENGTSFTYRNQFGGFWVSTPFDDSAQAQSYTPPLDQRWDYSTDTMYGVNIGGWLVTEPFIVPGLFEPFADTANPAVDEWSLSVNLGDNLHDTLVEHYETFITEQDFADIAAAGMNWVRIALPFWAIEVYPGEPFLEGVSWQYFLKAIEWSRKYGLRINLDLHTIPGSQNGWNHSGKLGSINFMNGVMGIANAQRTLNYIRVITEFINQPQYRNVVPMFGIINEAQANVIGVDNIRAFYLEVYEMMREITGIGEGNGPVISLHDGFLGDLSIWNGFLGGSDRMMMDSHPYLAFDTPNQDPMALQINKPCAKWGAMFNSSMANIGFTYAGEWSLGINDCGQYLNGVTDGIRFEGTYTGTYTPGNFTGSCDAFNDASIWDAEFKEQLIDLALASMDTFQHGFFWTWKIGVSSVYGRVATPLWSYSLGLQEGYVPSDPRAFHGACMTMADKYNQPRPDSVPFNPPLAAWMTGGPGAGDIVPTQSAMYAQWPPVSMANIPLSESLAVAALPTYSATARALTLTASPTPTAQNSAPTPVVAASYFTPIAGCTNYMDPWEGFAQQPTGTC